MKTREQQLNRRFSLGMLAAKKVVNAFTGESEKKAGKQAAKELGRGRAVVEDRAARARGDLVDLFGRAGESRRAGLEGALDVFRESIPLQASVAQGGNVAAQQQLLAGLPQIQNALIGTQPVNLSGLQPTQLPFELNFINRPLPAAPEPQAQPPAIDMASILAGR